MGDLGRLEGSRGVGEGLGEESFGLDFGGRGLGAVAGAGLGGVFGGFSPAKAFSDGGTEIFVVDFGVGWWWSFGVFRGFWRCHLDGLFVVFSRTSDFDIFILYSININKWVFGLLTGSVLI